MPGSREPRPRVWGGRWVRACLVLLSIASLAPAATAAPVLSIDAARSHAEFGVRVLWIGKVIGRLDALQGAVHVEPGGQVRVDVNVDARVLRMRERDYEDFARGADFFDSARYPSITFRSRPFPLMRLAAGGPVQGELTLRGITHAVRFGLLPQPCPMLARVAEAAASAASAGGREPAVVAVQAAPPPLPPEAGPADAGKADTASSGTACRVLARGYIQRSRFGMNAHRFTIANRIELGLVLRVDLPATLDAPAPTRPAAAAMPALASSTVPRPR